MIPSEPFFSIIIPTYNAERTLGGCLESVLGQRFSNFEIIIVDGLSSDRTVEVAQKSNDPRIKLFSEKDEGIYDAMNKGIDLARGDWLLFLGSDDRLFDKNVLEDAHDYLVNTKAELVYGNSKLAGDAFFARDGVVYGGEFSLSKLFSKNICHQSIFYSKKIFSKVGRYDTKYHVCADWELNLRCFAMCAVQHYDRVITLFSGGGTSSRTLDDFTPKERLLKIKEYFGYGFLNHHFEPFRNVFLNEAIALYTRESVLEAFRYWAIYFYHADNKMQALKNVVAKLLSQASNSRRRR